MLHTCKHPYSNDKRTYLRQEIGNNSMMINHNDTFNNAPLTPQIMNITHYSITIMYKDNNV